MKTIPNAFLGLAFAGLSLFASISAGAATAPKVSVIVNGTKLVDGKSSINFGMVTVGSSSTPKTFTIKNIGNAALPNIDVVGSGKQKSSFSGTAPKLKTLAPGQSTTFKGYFKPKVMGTNNMVIHVTNSFDATTFDIKLTGTGMGRATNMNGSFPGSPGTL